MSSRVVVSSSEMDTLLSQALRRFMPACRARSMSEAEDSPMAIHTVSKAVSLRSL
jgi:hypothetical protein